MIPEFPLKAAVSKTCRSRMGKRDAAIVYYYTCSKAVERYFLYKASGDVYIYISLPITSHLSYQSKNTYLFNFSATFFLIYCNYRLLECKNR